MSFFSYNYECAKKLKLTEQRIKLQNDYDKRTDLDSLS